MSETKGFEEGVEAFKSGVPRAHNPYSDETPYWDDWNAGWDAACKESLKNEAI